MIKSSLPPPEVLHLDKCDLRELGLDAIITARQPHALILNNVNESATTRAGPDGLGARLQALESCAMTLERIELVLHFGKRATRPMPVRALKSLRVLSLVPSFLLRLLLCLEEILPPSPEVLKFHFFGIKRRLRDALDVTKGLQESSLSKLRQIEVKRHLEKWFQGKIETRLSHRAWTGSMKNFYRFTQVTKSSGSWLSKSASDDGAEFL